MCTPREGMVLQHACHPIVGNASGMSNGESFEMTGAGRKPSRIGLSLATWSFCSPPSLPETRGSGRGRGFTLIELLVVVAIIAMLVAILMPSLSRARQQARAVKCLAHLRELAHGMVIYYDEWGNYPAHQWRLADGRAQTAQARAGQSEGVRASPARAI